MFVVDFSVYTVPCLIVILPFVLSLFVHLKWCWLNSVLNVSRLLLFTINTLLITSRRPKQNFVSVNFMSLHMPLSLTTLGASKIKKEMMLETWNLINCLCYFLILQLILSILHFLSNFRNITCWVAEQECFITGASRVYSYTLCATASTKMFILIWKSKRNSILIRQRSNILLFWYSLSLFAH